MAETQEVRDKVVLVGLNSPVLKKRGKRRRGHYGGALRLLETAGGECVAW